MFLICGEALFDLFLEAETSPAAMDFAARAGGSPFNVAIGMRRLTAEAGLMTALSTDMMGARLAAILEAEGVNGDYLLRTDRMTTLSVVGRDTDGVPAYSFYSAGSADTGVQIADVPDLGPEVTGVHLGAYSIAVPPVADALAALVERAGDRFISLDPNVRPTVEPDMAVWRERVEALLADVDLLKISSEDLEMLYPGMAPGVFALRCMEQGVEMVIVPDGGAAVHAWTTTGIEASVTPPRVDVVDTVGAGDTFQAALLYRLAATGDPYAAIAKMTVAEVTDILHFCAGAAAVTCTRRGADLPRLSDLSHLQEL